MCSRTGEDLGSGGRGGVSLSINVFRRKFGFFFGHTTYG
jgi:hypothetical protein